MGSVLLTLTCQSKTSYFCTEGSNFLTKLL
uniref:Uncharacterized protein n=1 Tax=Anguilla anguilla TaxID=7936 RepID=A0A0E9QN48_ANGAN